MSKQRVLTCGKSPSGKHEPSAIAATDLLTESKVLVVYVGCRYCGMRRMIAVDNDVAWSGGEFYIKRD